MIGGTQCPMDSPLTVDATGTACPVPIIELAKAVRRLAPGEIVILLATDPAAARDVGAWCESTGHQLVSLGFENGILRAQVRKLAA
jgi:tRNA 2-thiouridine synthesizing protein A